MINPYFSSFELLFTLLIVILVSLAIREVVTWYWKINKICDILEKIEKNTAPKTIAENKTE